MRLWHKNLISVLPKQQLLGQWRELNSIFKNQNRHILINFVYDYPKGHLYTYSMMVAQEMKRRNYKVDFTNFNNYFEIDINWANEDYCFKDKMNNEYFKICYYKKIKKYRCGGISDEEWQKIEDLVGWNN